MSPDKDTGLLNTPVVEHYARYLFHTRPTAVISGSRC